MDIAYNSEWNSSKESIITSWCRDKLTELDADGAATDEQLVTYIAVMVGNKKTIAEIHDELKELIDEDISREFVTELGKKIQEMNGTTPSTAKSTTKAVKSTNIEDKLGKSLSAGRASTKAETKDRKVNSRDPVKSHQKNVGSVSNTRLLQSALSSTKESSQTSKPMKDALSTPRHLDPAVKPSEKLIIKRVFETNGEPNTEVFTKKRRENDLGNKGGNNTATINIPVNVLENMKQQAFMMGFRSVEEMMAFHNNIPPMMPMHPMMGIPPFPPRGYPPYPAPFPPGPGHFQGMPFDGYGFGAAMPFDGMRGRGGSRGGRYGGRGGRGYEKPATNQNSRATVQDISTKAATEGGLPKSAPIQSAPTESEPKANQAEAVESSSATKDESSPPVGDSTSTFSAGFASRGRGFVRGRGRGFTGRFSDPSGRGFPGRAKNMIWVRQADVATPLVGNR